MFDVVQHVHHVRAADAGRIVNSGVRMSCMFAKLRGALFAQLLHVIFGAEVQTSGGTRFDAGRFKARADAIRA